MQYIIIWLPRALAVIMTVLVLLFAVETAVVESASWILPLVAALPGLVILIATVIAWIRPFFGGVVFIALGLSCVYQAYLQSGMDDSVAMVLMVGVPVLAGILFLLQKANSQYVTGVKK